MREFAIRDVFDAAEEATGSRLYDRDLDFDGFDFSGMDESPAGDGAEPVLGYVDQDEPPAPPPAIVQHPTVFGKRLGTFRRQSA